MTILIVLPILTALMFELGLTLNPMDFKQIVSRPRRVIAGLIGQVLLLPFIAYVIASEFDLDTVLAVGLILIACCPGGSSSNIFSMLAGGDVALSVSLTALSSVITLFTMPLFLAWVTTEGVNGGGISLPVGNLLIQNVVLMLVPIVGGILVRRYAARTAEKLHRILSRLAFPALMLLAVVFFISEYQAILDNFSSLGLSVTLLMCGAMLIGYVISKIFLLDSRDTRTIIIEVGMQNAAQAIAVAGSPFVFNNPQIAAPAIIYALVMNVALLTYVGILRRKSSIPVSPGD